MLRESLGAKDDLRLRAFWTNERREVHARLLMRLLILRPPNAALRDRNLDFRRARGELGYAYFGRRLALRALAEGPADVLHFHTQTTALLSLDLMRRLPAVITTDQTAYRLAEETGSAWRWTHGPSVLMERRALRAAAAVVTFSEFARGQMIALHGLAPERVSVIPPGLPPGLFAPRAMRQTEPDAPVRVLFVGGEFERKGGRDLVAVFTALASPNAELHVVTRNAADVPRHPRIVVHPDVTANSPRWRELYERADIFALPTYRDGFGLAFVEAMWAGLPVLGTTYAPVPEIVKEGVTGLLVRPGDRVALAAALARLIADPGLRVRLGAAGARRAADSFDASRNATRLAEVFHRVAGRPQ
jgi:glycosyltransferase involved in cell wall biosynthesis